MTYVNLPQCPVPTSGQQRNQCSATRSGNQVNLVCPIVPWNGGQVSLSKINWPIGLSAIHGIFQSLIHRKSYKFRYPFYLVSKKIMSERRDTEMTLLIPVKV